MQMKQPQNRQRGAAGETAVKGFFEDLGWGAISTGDHDLGTDLYLQLRDDEGVELLLMMGVQVKTGSTTLAEAATVDGRSGWWFREDDQRHLGYWSEHPVPHILVLQDETRTRRYWAYLNRKSIETTGKGIRVFVPDTQPLADSFRDAWGESAERALRSVEFEGSRWNYDASSLPDQEQLRMALLTPRLVVPHPNRGSSRPITWAQAAAMVIDSSAARWEESAERHGVVPSFDDALGHLDERWQFAGALYRWRSGADTGPLEAVAASTRGTRLGVATAVALSIALEQTGRPEAAADALRGNLVSDEHTPDQGWLRVRIAALEMEQGNDATARSMAEEAIVRLAAFARDVTVSALRSAATWVLFETNQTMARDLSKILPDLDNMASWWRSQVVSSGLSMSTTQAFRKWARDSTIVIGGTANARNRLVSAELLANLAGLTSQASDVRALRAKVDLLEDRDTVGALNGLLMAGDDKALKSALRQVRGAGSPGALTEFIAGVNMSTLSRTTFHAGLTAVAEAGDYTSSEQGARLAADITDMLLRRVDRATRLRPRLLATGPMLEALAGVVVFADDAVALEVVDHLFDVDHDKTHELPFAHLLRRLDDAGRLYAVGARMTKAVQDERLSSWQRQAFAARTFQEENVRAAISSRILGGDIASLRSLPDLTHLTHDEVTATLRACWAGLQAVTDSARRGSMAVAKTDTARLGAGLLLVHHRSDEWGPLLQFLEDLDVAFNLKIDVCRFLAANASSVPLPIRTALLQALPAIRASKSMPDPSGQQLDFSCLDVLEAGLADDDESVSPVAARLQTSSAEGDRVWSVDRLSVRRNVDALTGFLVDPSPRVRARAVRALAALCLIGDPTAHRARVALEACAPTLGETALTAMLNEWPRSVRRERPELVPLLGDLERHPAWSIRHLATALLEGTARGGK